MITSIIRAAVLLPTCLAIAFAGSPEGRTIPAGSKIYINSATEGFDTYLTAALDKKKVPVTIVADKAKADYELSAAAETKKAGWAKIAFTGSIHSDEEASVKLVDLKSSEVVFAYSVNKKNSWHGKQSAAESCAKHLKDVVR